jgi:hypothetical protein
MILSQGDLVYVGRPQGGISYYNHSPFPGDLFAKPFNGHFNRGEIVLILKKIDRMVFCLSVHGLVWATLDGFREII